LISMPSIKIGKLFAIFFKDGKKIVLMPIQEEASTTPAKGVTKQVILTEEVQQRLQGSKAKYSEDATK
jgi:hypothetical protein